MDQENPREKPPGSTDPQAAVQPEKAPGASGGASSAGTEGGAFEWGSTLTVGGVSYATSLYWQPLQEPDDPMQEIREMVENSSNVSDADLFCIRKGSQSQYGLAFSKDGHKQGLPVAAIAVAEAFADKPSTVAVFKVPEGWWYLAVRNDLILPEEEVLFLREEEARKAFSNMMAVPDWGRKIAPASWGIAGAQEIDLASVLSGAKQVKLQKLAAKSNAMPWIVGAVLLLVLIGAYFLFTSLFSTPPQMPTLTAPVVLQKPSMEVKLDPPPPPWAQMTDPIAMMKACDAAHKRIMDIVVPGWLMQDILCEEKGGVISTWTTAPVSSVRLSFLQGRGSTGIGHLEWARRAFKAPGLSDFSTNFMENAQSMKASLNKQQKLFTGTPKMSYKDIREQIVEIFQGIASPIRLTRNIEKTPWPPPANPTQQMPPDPEYICLDFIFSSSYGPDQWVKFVEKFPGLRMEEITYNSIYKADQMDNWTYKGRIYEKK